ncbi:MAG TPA: acylphosphatase [Burkholderiales bacterium]|nr:acylphosphatase [Burkholderiales bacterium]
MKITKRLIVRGRVQGVGYRQSMRTAADRIGVTGWVRNLRNGTVEAVVQGAPDDVSRMLTWAERGPPGAHVASVDVSDASGEFDRFEHWPSA